MTDAVGTKVYDAHGVTRIVATKANGVKHGTPAAHQGGLRARRNVGPPRLAVI